ncbi:MAG: hypothetical protein R3E48_14775 [Burkholderiaceae bacterium]
MLGDQVRIPPLRLPSAAPSRQIDTRRWSGVGAALPVVFEDEALLVVDKPAGLAVHGGSGVSASVVERFGQPGPRRASSSLRIGSIATPRAC